jgi:hypothetical protein
MRRCLLLTSVLILLAACQTVPVYTVENAEIFTASGKKPTLAQVRKAIRRAAVSKTWKVRELNPNTLVAQVVKKTIAVVVTIEFTTDQYSIKYRDSKSLSYKDGMIRSRYNSWVTKLRARIEERFLDL